jgi:hypothetical protein
VADLLSIGLSSCPACRFKLVRETGVGRGGTGECVDYVIADNAHKIDEADSLVARPAVLRWSNQDING